jgi:hypothetical protein
MRAGKKKSKLRVTADTCCRKREASSPAGPEGAARRTRGGACPSLEGAGPTTTTWWACSLGGGGATGGVSR